MSALSPSIIIEFCKLCDWAHESWITRKIIFDDNSNIENLMKGDCGYFLERLSKITHEYALLQLIKLHDPSVQRKSVNLSIDYVIRFGGWDKKTTDSLVILSSDMEGRLAQSVKSARNKIITHNDIEAILNGSPLGSFDLNADLEYFNKLQEFVNIVHEKSIGRPFPFNNSAQNDAQVFKNILNSTLKEA